MSDSTVKWDWFDIVKGMGGALATTVVGLLLRLLFGRVLKGIDDKLDRLEKSNDAQTEELKEVRGQIADCRTGILLVQQDVENLKTPRAPSPTPRAGG